MEKKKEGFSLPSKKVTVVPVRRSGGLVPIGHENDFLFKHSAVEYNVPRQQRNGELADPLTDEERTYFESKDSGLSLERGDLSIHKKDRNYWSTFTVKLDKNVLELDLSNPMDYIRWKVLLVNKDHVAPSEAEKFNKGTYKFAIVEEGAQEVAKAKVAVTKKDAYILLGTLLDSATKMKNFLGVYNSTKPGTKKIAPNASLEFLQIETEKALEENMSSFIEILRDKNYDTKILINQAMTAKALVREGLTYKTLEGLTIGDSLQDVVGFFGNKVNTEEVLKIKARIENSI